MRINPGNKKSSQIDYLADRDKVLVVGDLTRHGSNGARCKLKVKEVLHTLATGGLTSTITGFFEDGMCVLGLVARVTTTLVAGNRTTVALSDGAADYAVKAALVAGTTLTQADASAIVAPKIYNAAANLVTTLSGGTTGDITAGVIRITCFYLEFTAPTS